MEALFRILTRIYAGAFGVNLQYFVVHFTKAELRLHCDPLLVIHCRFRFHLILPNPPLNKLSILAQLVRLVCNDKSLYCGTSRS